MIHSLQEGVILLLGPTLKNLIILLAQAADTSNWLRHQWVLRYRQDVVKAQNRCYETIELVLSLLVKYHDNDLKSIWSDLEILLTQLVTNPSFSHHVLVIIFFHI